MLEGDIGFVFVFVFVLESLVWVLESLENLKIFLRGLGKRSEPPNNTKDMPSGPDRQLALTVSWP